MLMFLVFVYFINMDVQFGVLEVLPLLLAFFFLYGFLSIVIGNSVSTRFTICFVFLGRGAHLSYDSAINQNSPHVCSLVTLKLGMTCNRLEVDHKIKM